MNKSTTAKRLTYAGALPFLLLPLIGLATPTLFGVDIWLALTIYGAVIVSFISGIHWGIYLLQDQLSKDGSFNGLHIDLFLRSNVVALLAWGAAAFNSSLSLLLFVPCFIYLLMIDRQLHLAMVFGEWYMTLRERITRIVVVSLIFGFAIRLLA